MNSVLNIRNVNKKFGKVNVLNDININLNKGEFLVLVGPSGCGKSTLLNCIAGLEKIDSGDIHIDEKNMINIEPKDRDIAMVFQSYALYPTMTVEKNITFGMKVRGLDKEIQKNKLQEVVKQLQIENLLNRKPSQLSGGQRQRIAIARAFYLDAKLLILDEATSALDNKTESELINALSQMKNKLTIIFIAHRLTTIKQCDCIYEFENGEIKAKGKFDELKEKSKSFAEMIKISEKY